MIRKYGDRFRESVSRALRRVGLIADERDLIERTPIPTFDFIERAQQYLQAYDDLPDRTAQTLFDWPRYAMLLHAVEMALKSYLIARGMPLRRAKGFGHNLKRLVGRARANGIALTDPTIKHVEQMSKAHLDNLPRYPNYDGGLSQGIIDVREWVPAAKEVVTTVKALVMPTVGGGTPP